MVRLWQGLTREWGPITLGEGLVTWPGEIPGKDEVPGNRGSRLASAESVQRSRSGRPAGTSSWSYWGSFVRHRDLARSPSSWSISSLPFRCARN